MIHASGTTPDRSPPLDRGAAIVLVLAFAILAVAGAIHTGDGAHGGHVCTVCDAIVAVGGASVPAAAPVAGLAVAEDAVGAIPPCHAAVREFEVAVAAAPRGPPWGTGGQG